MACLSVVPFVCTQALFLRNHSSELHQIFGVILHVALSWSCSLGVAIRHFRYMDDFIFSHHQPYGAGVAIRYHAVHQSRNFRGGDEVGRTPMLWSGDGPPTFQVFQVRNFAFKTSNAEMQSTNYNVIYSNVKRPIN